MSIPIRLFYGIKADAQQRHQGPAAKEPSKRRVEVLVEKGRLVIPKGKRQVPKEAGQIDNATKNTEAKKLETPSKVTETIPAEEAKSKSAPAQTDVSICSHQCKQHFTAVEPESVVKQADKTTETTKPEDKKKQASSKATSSKAAEKDGKKKKGRYYIRQCTSRYVNLLIPHRQRKGKASQ